MTNDADEDGGNGTYTGMLVDIYDLIYPDPAGDIPVFVDFMRKAVQGTRVLEYGIGTGRIAIPLAEAGFHVTGTDISTEMLSRLAEKDPTGRIDAHVSSFLEEPIAGTYDAVILMINTIFVANSLDQQLAVFTNAAAHLTDEGFFLVETFNPNDYHNQTSPMLSMRQIAPTTVIFEQFIVDPASQLYVAQNLVLGAADKHSYVQVLRYMFPFEMDAIALNTGLVLKARMSDWVGTPYTSTSSRCVSLYRKA